MPSVSDYEKLRQQNIDQNRKVLQELGLLNTFKAPIFLPKPKQIRSEVKKRRRINYVEQVSKRPKLSETSENRTEETDEANIRRSSRIRGKPALKFKFMSNEEEKENESDDDFECYDESDDEEGVHYTRRKSKQPVVVIPKGRENRFGEIPNVPVGKFWMMRVQCSFDEIHRPVVAGIHGNVQGCYSIALSGGYEDDLDYGEWFTYTGSGGRDLKGTKNKPKNLRTAPQSKDQTLTGANLSLSKNIVNEQPVRVIRGFKLKSPYAPKEGYRYDGLYTVEKYWFTTGLSGFGVYKFALKRCENQPPAPWTYSTDEESNCEKPKVKSEEEDEGRKDEDNVKEDELETLADEKISKDEDNVTEDELETLDDEKISKDEDTVKEDELETLADEKISKDEEDSKIEESEDGNE